MGTASNKNGDTVSMITTDASTGSPKSKSKLKKLAATTEGLQDMIKNMVSLVKSAGKTNEPKVIKNDEGTLLLENRHVKELLSIIDQHNKHLTLLKEMGMLSEEKKVAIVGDIESIFSIVNNRSSSKKRSSVDISSDTSNVSN